MLRAVLFDLDGTLADTERQNAESVARVLARRGRPLTDEERDFVGGHGWAEIYPHLVAHGGVDLAFPHRMAEAAHERQAPAAAAGPGLAPAAGTSPRQPQGEADLRVATRLELDDARLDDLASRTYNSGRWVR